jgi:hypothetical protein
MEMTLSESEIVGSKEFLPERRLAAAVLGVALADYQKFGAAQDTWSRWRFAEVSDWFMSDVSGWEFSFVNVCAILNLDVSATRAGVRACRRRPSLAAYGPGFFGGE